MQFNIGFGLVGLQQVLRSLRSLTGSAVGGSGLGASVLSNVTRLGLGLGPFSPLISQFRAFSQNNAIAGALGGTTATRPLATAIALISRFALAMHALNLAFQHTMATVQRLISQLEGTIATGGNFASFGTLQGMLGSQAVSMARSFRDRIASQPMAMVEAARHGMRAFPREFGFTGVDDASLLLKEIGTIRAFKTEHEALNHVMIMGTEELYKWRYATEGQIKALRLEGALRGQMTRALAPAAARLSIELDRIKQQWQDLGTVLGTILIPVLQAVTGLVMLLTAPHRFLAMTLERLAGGGGGNGNSGNHQEALRSNTAALNNNTRALGRTRRVWGGEKAQHAIPSGLRNEALSHWLADGYALSLGQIR